jgi:MFS family permease
MSRLWLLIIIPASIIGALLFSLVVLWLFAVIPWWGVVSALFIIGLIVLWVAVVADLFRRADLHAWQIALWLALVIILPVIGAFIYYFARPRADQIRYRGESPA